LAHCEVLLSKLIRERIKNPLSTFLFFPGPFWPGLYFKANIFLSDFMERKVDIDIGKSSREEVQHTLLLSSEMSFS
jgi:hypothetical protein